MGVAANVVAFYCIGLPAILAVAVKRSEWGVGGLWWVLAGAAYLQAALMAGAVLRFNWRIEAERAARRVHSGG